MALFLIMIPAAAAGPGAEVWKELLASRPQENGVPLADIVLVRDSFTFHLDSGAFFPLAEVSGRVVGGVFRGKGRFELKPATESERAFLARRAGQKDLQVLADTFEEAVFLFTDGSGKELLPVPPSVPASPEELASIYDDALKKAEKGFRADLQSGLIADKELHADLRLRLIPDLIEAVPSDQGLFLAYFDGDKLPPSIATFSPRGLVRTWFEMDSGPETTALAVLHEEKGGFWYSECPLPTQTSASAPAALTADVKALRYTVETTIRKNTDIEGRTTLRLRSARDGVRVIPLDLLAKLRLSSVRLKSEARAAVDLPFIQGDEKSADPVLAILPSPLAAGEEAELSFDYRGDGVIQDVYGGIYVSARGNWHPALNALQDWAVYDLTYRIPKKRRIISVGKLVGSINDGEFTVYRFTTERAVRGAAFNYGEFSTIEQDDPDSGIRIRVYPNLTLPDHLWATSQDDFRNIAWDVLADSINTARVGTAYFGPLVQNEIAVTEQVQWGLRQSWPALICIPSIAFTGPSWRVEIVLNFLGNKFFVKEVTPREFAHQWWGNSVGSATYRDAWLEDGLAEFTVGLVLEKALGAKEFRAFWRRARRDTLGNGEVGPISLGRRLASPETPSSYMAIVRRKGAFIVQMLRNLFWDEKSANPEHRFIETMKDFAATWAGRDPATDDFRVIAERHAPPDFAGDMGWFFREWIEGTAIPKIKTAIRIEEAGNGQYRLTGEITQTEVPEDFRSILPLYVEVEKNRFMRCAQVSITGNRALTVRQEISLPKKPLRVLVNPNHEWLTR